MGEVVEFPHAVSDDSGILALVTLIHEIAENRLMTPGEIVKQIVEVLLAEP